MGHPKNVILATLMLLGLVAPAGCGNEAVTMLTAEEPRAIGDGTVVVDLADDERTVATVAAWTRGQRGGMREVLVQFPYVEGVDYRLDSFSIEFAVGEAYKSEILMVPPPYPWKSTRFHRTAQGVRFEVSEVADYGTGSIDLSFWVPEELMSAEPLLARATLTVRQGEGSVELGVRQ